MVEPKIPNQKFNPEIESQVKANQKKRLKRNIGIGVSVVIVLIILLLLAIRPVKKQITSYQCLKCHNEYQDKKSFKFVHTGFKNEGCTRCHTKHGGETVKVVWKDFFSILRNWLFGKKVVGKTTVKTVNKGVRPKKISKLVKSEAKLCDDCHQSKKFKDWKKAKFKHPPYKESKCTSCHDAHASKFEGVLREKPSVLCPSCHEISKAMKKNVLHPPFKKKNCADCHEAHASNYEKHIMMDQKKLCGSCHAQLAKLYKFKYQMKPFKEGKCTKCHNPHSSQYKKLWRNGPSAGKMCFSCHDGTDGQNVKKFLNDKYKMKPYTDEKCMECHKPHATKDPKLLKGRGNDFCYKCHGKYKKYYVRISHNKAKFNKDSPNDPIHGRGSCLSCHMPHGSNYVGLTYKEVISLCTTCHTKEYKGTHVAHPVSKTIKDPWNGSYLRCTSCHNPMGNGHVKLLKRSGDNLCISCHNNSNPAKIKKSSK